MDRRLSEAIRTLKRCSIHKGIGDRQLHPRGRMQLLTVFRLVDRRDLKATMEAHERFDPLPIHWLPPACIYSN